MTANTTFFSGHFLFVNAHKQYHRDRNPYRIYYKIADVAYKKMSHENRALWDKFADDIRMTDEAHIFLGIDTALKYATWQEEKIKKQLLALRNFACMLLYYKCFDLLMQTM